MRTARESLGSVLREPAELTIADDGTVSLPLGLLAEAGLAPGTEIFAFSQGDGRIVLRRQQDAVQELLDSGNLT